MSSLKISLITVCYNAAPTIRRCIESVISQDYSNLEYIIIDGASTDQTSAIVNEYRQHITRFVSEPDKGLYDAMNKGIAMATGEVIGILNADDFFITSIILSGIATAFSESGADIVYGNLNFINPAGRIVRKWWSGEYKSGLFNKGWMPPHPTFYARKSLFEQLGNYNTNYGSAADYELMLRFMHRYGAKAFYLNITFLHMLTGGVSNKSLLNRVKAYRYDYMAMQHNGIIWPLVALILKPLRKIWQFTS